MFVHVKDEGGEVKGFRPDVGEGPSHDLVDEQPQFTGRTLERAPNRVLAIVREILLGFFGLRMGIKNFNTLFSLGFQQFER